MSSVPSNPSVTLFQTPYWEFNADSNLIPVIPAKAPSPSVLTSSDQKLLLDSLPGLAPGMDATPFFEISIKNSPMGGSLISWGLKRSFNDPLSYRFDIYWGETATGTLTRVDTPVLINTYFAVDPTRRLFALDIESFYAIKLTTPNGEYWSYVTNANSFWNKRDWLIARDICRKEFLICRKFTGWYGFLLKRKIWGANCPRCSDFDTKEAADGHCEICYGTAKDGGYWSPFPTFVYNMEAGPTQFKQIDDKAGLNENIVLPKMRMLASVLPATNDVFIQYGSGKRFFLRPINVAAEIKGMPIVYVCELRLAPYTDIIYLYPIITPPPTPPPVPPEPESEPYVPPESTTLVIQWFDGEWRLGPDTDTTLYRTNAGYPVTGFDSFTWVHEDGTPADLTFSEIPDGWTIEGDPVVDGSYITAGATAGLPVFLRAEE